MQQHNHRLLIFTLICLVSLSVLIALSFIPIGTFDEIYSALSWNQT